MVRSVYKSENKNWMSNPIILFKSRFAQNYTHTHTFGPNRLDSCRNTAKKPISKHVVNCCHFSFSTYNNTLLIIFLINLVRTPMVKVLVPAMSQQEEKTFDCAIRHIEPKNVSKKTKRSLVFIWNLTIEMLWKSFNLFPVN